MDEFDKKRKIPWMKVTECIGKGIVEEIIDLITVNSPVAAALKNISTNLSELYIENKRGETSYEIALEQCDQYLPERYDEYKYLISSVVEYCISQMQIMEFYNPDFQEMAEYLCKGYLRQYNVQLQSEKREEYNIQLKNEEEEILERYLPDILNKVIEKLRLQYEEDTELQVVFKQECSRNFHDIRKELEQQKKQDVNYTIQEMSEDFRGYWNEDAFLSDVPLSQLFLFPNYQDSDDGVESRLSLSEKLQEVLTSSNIYKKRMLVIFGLPGSGKSTLLTEMLNNELVGINRKVRLYCIRQFTINENSKKTIDNQLLEQMGIIREDLDHSVLILDGLDEILLADYVRFLNKLNEQWAKKSVIEDFTLIVTCRSNRINVQERYKLNNIHWIELDSYDKYLIKQFVFQFHQSCPLGENTAESIERLATKNSKIKEVLGIPLLLYMILALDIELKDVSNLLDIYRKIFSVEGRNSVYYCENYKHSDRRVEQTIAMKIHDFSKKMAVYIWKYHPKEAVIKGIELKKIYKDDEHIARIISGQYIKFMEGEKDVELCFVHRSMYEYFTALSIYDSIKGMLNDGILEDQFQRLMEKGSKEDLSILKFAKMIGIDNLTEYPEIKEYLSKMLSELDIEDTEWWKTMLALFLDKGFTHYVDDYKEKSLTRINNENNRFYNLVWLTREHLKRVDKTSLVYRIAEVDEIFLYYIRQNKTIVDLGQLDLKEVNLSRVDLSRADLSKANLSKANLSKANLNKANLSKTDLSVANLSKADLSGCNLNGADLSGCNLSGADLSGCNLNGADLSGCNLSGADLSRANLSRAHLRGAYLKELDLSEAYLCVADLSGANLRGGNLSGVNLSGADLRNSGLSGVDLSECDLSGSNLSGADLEGVIVDLEKLRKAILDEENYRKFFGDEGEPE